MGATHTTDREKQLFQHLVSSGMSVHKVSRLTGRSHACITNNVDTDVMAKENQTSTWTDEDMYKIFDLHSAGKRVVDISREMNRPNQTVSSITRRVNPKHQKAYAKWLELQKHEEVSPALVMEVQTVEAQRQDEPEQPGIDWQAKWCEAQQQIAELKEINSILKGYVRHLQRLNEQQDRM